MMRNIIAALLLIPSIVQGADVLQSRQLSMELAGDIARESINACRELGYQVSAVVVDRSGIVQIVMRDTLATRFNTEIARKKANAVVLSGTSSGNFRNNRKDILNEMNQLDDVLVLRGALPIRAAGNLLGAIGVSGAQGGELDEKCAQTALDKMTERLEFAE